MFMVKKLIKENAKSATRGEQTTTQLLTKEANSIICNARQVMVQLRHFFSAVFYRF